METVSKIDKARERARNYYQIHREVVKAKNLARYYEKLGKEPKIKNADIETKLGMAYLKEAELEGETISSSS